MGHDVVGDDHVGRPVARRSSAASSVPKNVWRVGMPISRAAAAGPGVGSIPSTGTPRSSDVPQQVAVVARDLDDELSGPSRPLGDQPLDVLARMERAGPPRTTRSTGTPRRRWHRRAAHRSAARACRSRRSRPRAGTAAPRAVRSASLSRAFATGVSPRDRNGRRPGAPHERHATTGAPSGIDGVAPGGAPRADRRDPAQVVVEPALGLELVDPCEAREPRTVRSSIVSPTRR